MATETEYDTTLYIAHYEPGRGMVVDEVVESTAREAWRFAVHRARYLAWAWGGPHYRAAEPIGEWTEDGYCAGPYLVHVPNGNYAPAL